MTVWYRQGTASVANGSTSVSGALTAWASQALPGDGISFDGGGKWYEVASVGGNTSLTLATPFAEATVIGAAYAIDRKSSRRGEVSRALALVQDMLARLTTLILTDGVPDNSIGNDGAIAFDSDTKLFYFKDGGEWSAPITLAGPQGEPGTNGSNGSNGTNGWAPVLSIENDSARRVLKVTDWQGGSGTKPAVNKYVGATGLVDAIGDAVDVRGPQGIQGNTGSPGANGTGLVAGILELPEQGSAPATPSAGTLKVYAGTDHKVYKKDSTGTVAEIGAGGGGGGTPKNAIINGSFSIWQRTANDTGVTTTRKYVADRFGVKTGAGTLANVRRSTSVRAGGMTPHCLEMVGATGVTTVDVDQRIEAVHVPPVKREIVFAAWVYNATGAAFQPTLFVSTPSAADNWASAAVRNNGGSGDALQSCADNAWTRVSWSADVSGYTNISNGLEFRLRVPSGSLVAGDTVRIAEMQVAAGNSPGDFETLPFGDDLIRCQRYFEKSWALDTVVGTATQTGATGLFMVGGGSAAFLAGVTVPFNTRKRVAPTVTTYSFATGASGKIRDVMSNADVNSTASSYENQALMYATNAASTAGYNLQWHWTADAEL